MFCFLFKGIFVASNAIEINEPTSKKQITDDDTTTADDKATSGVVAKEIINDATKDKRQTKDTKTSPNYANHRGAVETASRNAADSNSDDPENPQETIYGTNARQFLIRPQQQQNANEEEQHQQQQQPTSSQLRNYPVTIRPHSTQLLEQSQEVSNLRQLAHLVV